MKYHVLLIRVAPEVGHSQLEPISSCPLHAILSGPCLFLRLSLVTTFPPVHTLLSFLGQVPPPLQRPTGPFLPSKNILDLDGRDLSFSCASFCVTSRYFSPLSRIYGPQHRRLLSTNYNLSHRQMLTRVVLFTALFLFSGTSQAVYLLPG